MNVTPLMQELRRRGIQLTVEGEHLRVRSRGNSFTTDLREAVTLNKRGIIKEIVEPVFIDLENVLRQFVVRC